jgi:hypothetical protein
VCVAGAAVCTWRWLWGWGAVCMEAVCLGCWWGSLGRAVRRPGGIGRTCGRSTPGCVCLTQGVCCCCGCAARCPFAGGRRQGRSERGAGGDIRVSGTCGVIGVCLLGGSCVALSAGMGSWGPGVCEWQGRLCASVCVLGQAPVSDCISRCGCVAVGLAVRGKLGRRRLAMGGGPSLNNPGHWTRLGVGFDLMCVCLLV